MGGRVYDPVVGRFLSVDPILGTVGESQSHNPYSYVWNQPLVSTDPDGLEPSSYGDPNVTEQPGNADSSLPNTGVSGNRADASPLSPPSDMNFQNSNTAQQASNAPQGEGSNGTLTDHGSGVPSQRSTVTVTADRPQVPWGRLNWWERYQYYNAGIDRIEYEHQSPTEITERVIDNSSAQLATLDAGSEGVAAAVVATVVVKGLRRVAKITANRVVRAIRNSHLAGSVHPKTGIPFDSTGHADFSKVAIKSVTIVQTGNRAIDEAAANAAAGLKSTPRGFTWHHHQNGSTMQLVPSDVHAATGHTGGVALRSEEK
jgi:hypothetical protein